MNTVFSRMSAVEEPVSIRTANLGLMLQKRHGSEMNNTSTMVMMDNSMIMPSLNNMNLNDSLSMNIKVRLVPQSLYAPKS